VVSRVVAVLTAVTASALVLRLAGVFRESLPSAGQLAALLAAMHLGRVLFSRPGDPVTLVTRATRLDEWRAFVRAHAFGIGLFAACVLALIVRLPGFASDLGHTPLDIDERRLAANVRQFLVSGEFHHSHIEHYPGAAYWLFVASSFLAFLRGLNNGLTGALSVEAVAQASRLANIGAGVLTVAITALVGLRVSGTTAGLVGALLVAIAPISIETTVLVRNDSGMVLAVMAATYAALVYYENGKLASIAAAGALAGLAAAIKYSAVFALVPVLVAAFLFSGAPMRTRARAAAIAVLAFGIAVAISNHFIWADFPNFLRQLADQHSFTGMGHPWSTENPASVYLMTLAWAGPGWPMVLLAAAFTVYALSTRRPGLWIFVSFPVAYIWFMTQRPLQVPRWVYPLVPFVAVAGAAALVGAFQWLNARLTSRPMPWFGASRVAAALFVVGVLWQPVWAGAVTFSRRISRPTHDLAETWIREHADPGTVVLLGQGWLDLGETQLTTRRVPNLKVALDGGVEQLGGCDWIVIPEPLFDHPALRQLIFLQRFESDRAFGGNLGLDYEVYAVPEIFAETACGNPER